MVAEGHLAVSGQRHLPAFADRDNRCRAYSHGFILARDAPSAAPSPARGSAREAGGTLADRELRSRCPKRMRRRKMERIAGGFRAAPRSSQQVSVRWNRDIKGGGDPGP